MNRIFKIIDWVLFIICALTYVGAYTWLAIQHHSNDPLYAIFWLIFFIVGELTAAPLHECGHALFGLFSGVRAKLSLKSFAPQSRPSSVEVVPTTDKDLKHRIIATSLGGIAVNFIFVVFGIFALALPQLPLWLSGISLAHLLLFIDNVLPIEYKNGKTDGMVIYELIKNEDGARVMLAVLTAQAQILKGKPVAELDEKLLFDLPQIREDDPAFISLTELRYEYFNANGDKENAEKCKARLDELKKDYLS